MSDEHEAMKYDYQRAHAQLDAAGVPKEYNGSRLSLAERVAWLRGKAESLSGKYTKATP
jgi:hypothetical protein